MRTIFSSKDIGPSLLYSSRKILGSILNSLDFGLKITENIPHNINKNTTEIGNAYINQVANYLKKGNLLDGIRITLGIYEGSQNLPELDNNDYYLFDGEYNASVKQILKESINNIALEVNEIVKSDEAVLQIIDLIFERIKLYDVENDDDEDRIFYNIKYFFIGKNK